MELCYAENMLFFVILIRLQTIILAFSKIVLIQFMSVITQIERARGPGSCVFRILKSAGKVRVRGTGTGT